jgi:glycosyltransferase involved in cell wall biosynthesis
MAAISGYVAGLVCNIYHQEAEVIYPPVDVDRFKPHNPRGNYFITVSRLVAHKRIDLIVEAFSALNQPLIVVGVGPELARLKKVATPNITFAGYQDDTEVEELLGRARAFVHASEEDFGIAMVEAQAAGCPVIAYGKGAALETICEGETGLFFHEQSASSLIDAVDRFERQARSFNQRACVINARRFNQERFKGEFREFINRSG